MLYDVVSLCLCIVLASVYVTLAVFSFNCFFSNECRRRDLCHCCVALCCHVYSSLFYARACHLLVVLFLCCLRLYVHMFIFCQSGLVMRLIAVQLPIVPLGHVSVHAHLKTFCVLAVFVVCFVCYVFDG